MCLPFVKMFENPNLLLIFYSLYCHVNNLINNQIYIYIYVYKYIYIINIEFTQKTKSAETFLFSLT